MEEQTVDKNIFIRVNKWASPGVYLGPSNGKTILGEPTIEVVFFVRASCCSISVLYGISVEPLRVSPTKSDRLPFALVLLDQVL
jgi:hypothetical protein